MGIEMIFGVILLWQLICAEPQSSECLFTETQAKCESACETFYVECVLKCAGETECVKTCNRQSVECEDDCPCHANCPNGVPCEVSLLVMNTFIKDPETRVFTWQIAGAARKEQLETLDGFITPDSSVDSSCSMVYHGQMYILGGYPDYRQISFVSGCNLIRSDRDLPMNMKGSLCTTYNKGEDAMICDGNECWQFLESGFKRLSDTNEWHDDGVMTEWMNMPLTIGGSDNVYVESYDGMRWNFEEPIPSWHSEDYAVIERFSAVNFKGAVYVFGGWPEWYHEVTAHRFDGQWSRIQDMVGLRWGHRSVVHQESIYHIGGYKNETDFAPFEQWTYVEEWDNFTVTVSDAELYDFYQYPETFVLDQSMYTECNK